MVGALLSCQQSNALTVLNTSLATSTLMLNFNEFDYIFQVQYDIQEGKRTRSRANEMYTNTVEPRYNEVGYNKILL